MPRYVVKPAEAVAPAGAEPIGDTGLYVVESDGPGQAFGGSSPVAWVAPTITDAGTESYPTGEVSVRFEAPPARADLDAFTRLHDVEVRRRNEFVPEQVVVAPAVAHAVWLPDLIDRLNEDAVVARAWPNTLSHYKRGVLSE